MINTRDDISKVKRVVVKVGTALLTGENNLIDSSKIKPIVNEIASLFVKGTEIILVTSGAVGIGMGVLGRKKRPTTLPEKQAFAAIGQSRLMHMYETIFSKKHINVSQVVLTADDLHDSVRFLNIKNAMNAILSLKVIPIINENDSVSVDELRFGDNDKLSANIAQITNADLLIILSDIDGLFDKNPQKFKDAVRIPNVDKITAKIYESADTTSKQSATGGMITKINAAILVTESGIPLVIANGLSKNIIKDVLAGKDKGTFFVPKKVISRKKSWIARLKRLSGTIVVDDGCKNALVKKGKSILPVGVLSVKGDFLQGDKVKVLDLNGVELGVGLITMSKGDAAKSCGKKTSELQKVFGRLDYKELIHRDNFIFNNILERL